MTIRFVLATVAVAEMSVLGTLVLPFILHSALIVGSDGPGAAGRFPTGHLALAALALLVGVGLYFTTRALLRKAPGADRRVRAAAVASLLLHGGLGIWLTVGIAQGTKDAAPLTAGLLVLSWTVTVLSVVELVSPADRIEVDNSPAA